MYSLWLAVPGHYKIQEGYDAAACSICDQSLVVPLRLLRRDQSLCESNLLMMMMPVDASSSLVTTAIQVSLTKPTKAAKIQQASNCSSCRNAQPGSQGPS
eukprot:gnl/TRDRNA2_/TRDRNA2_166867_c1_seq2.p1 gnl/TRDRNA2_/TRDRNA2_166867_c1~~gnl/TRDRNA2_/TRDRNA2_166867_c1_seq2.p1  ORF type:complete len:100 (-),score=6.59 gnl/TRDRNA2_/TRDRNA2_166867_c1_seq2:20-319(-)